VVQQRDGQSDTRNQRDEEQRRRRADRDQGRIARTTMAAEVADAQN
jgi:hypothetical protein